MGYSNTKETYLEIVIIFSIFEIFSVLFQTIKKILLR